MTGEPEPARADADPDTARQSCPECGGRDFAALCQSNGCTIARCAACGLTRTIGIGESDGAHYPPFDQGDGPLVRLLRFALSQLLRERLGFVSSVRPSGRLLDFGCGAGTFARLAHRAGYDVVGVEPFSLGRPVEQPGLRLVRAELDQIRPELGLFDVITLWQVLEHVPDPGALIERLVQHLGPDGVLVVSVPNLASWQSRVFGAAWFHLDPPRHLIHFDRSTLGELLSRRAFEVIAERTFHVEYGPVGWLQSFLNRILPRPNFLYEYAKDRGALRDVAAGERAVNLAVSLAAVAALATPSLIVEAVASGVGAGAVITVAARRRPTP